MLEHREVSGCAPKVGVVFQSDQEKPFAVNKTANQWQLSVNKTFFANKGFMPDEIDGAIYLEEEHLKRQVTANSPSVISGLRHWQDVGTNDPKATSFKAAFEKLSTLASLEEKDPQKAMLARKYLTRIVSRPAGSGYADQLFTALLQSGLKQEVVHNSKIVETVFNNLKKEEKIEGRKVSPLEALLSPDLSLESKASWFEARFLPRLQFLKQQERLDTEKEAKQEEVKTPPFPKDDDEQQELIPPTPTPSRDEYEQHRGREEKGKGLPIFIINPSYTGYWEEDSYDSLDEQTGRSIKSQTQRIKTALSVSGQSIIESSKRTINGNTGIALFNLPLAPGFQLTQQGLNELKVQGVETFSDVEGHTYLKPPANIKMNAEIAISANPVNLGINSKHNEITSQVLPDDVEQTLVRLRSLPTDSLGKLQEWRDFITSHFKYPKDEQVESMYATVDSNPARLNTLAENKLLDCYLAREFFIAGLKRLNLADVEWRAVNGHYIASSQKDRSAHISSGTAHAWVKIKVPGEKNWIILDPTPPGDPVHKNEGSLDEFGELSTESMSEENLAQLEKEAEKQLAKQNETQDQYLLQFAREASIDPTKAKEILANLAEVDQLKDSQGRNLLMRLKEQFDKVIEQYTELKQENLGLVEMSRGQELDDPVGAYIDIHSGSLDPTGFERKRIVEEKKQYYGGWDLEIIADGSGSMNETLGGRVKHKVQRDMSYLLHRALHRFSQEAQRRKLRLITPLKIRSSQYMFRGSDVEEIKPLSDQFTPPQMALLWEESSKNVGGGTPAHLGLQRVFDTITDEEKQLLKEKKLLKVVALISDGGYDNQTKVNDLTAQLQELNVVVAEFHITDAKSLDDLPQNVVEKVIEQARSLMPERIKK